jgi:oligopeptide transport system substrate-binding protein
LQGNLSGLTITIRQVPFNVKQDSLRNGSFQLGTANWIADFADPVNYVERFHSDINRGNYVFEDVDTLIETAKATYDDEEARWDLLVEAEQVAIGEHYVQLPTYQAAGAYLLKDHVKDLYIPVFGPDSYRYASIEE